ncbi:RHS repeat-associated core domain-containing protein [Paraburkholderia hayleyella]|uniref:RHS repeat-associated core domain-containing protein n=1 Tax=Paraburkholderia hayleyella TaxID=2152889 RepID=UPI0012915DBA|nr:RHS repeat-associated core domain-containing protein [Paraburkholderia hayleyella]
MPQPPPLLPSIDAAVVPLDQITLADLSAGSARFDAWLRESSGGYVTLERVRDVSASLPVLGNIMAAIDVCGDIVTLVQNRNTPRPAIDQTLDWASLGINLIGVLPIPVGTAAARMSLRPALGIVRNAVREGAKDLGSAIVAVLAAHVTATLMGELEPFVLEAKARLTALLKDCGDEAEKLLATLARALDDLAAGQLADPSENRKAADHKFSQVSASALVHSPLETVDNLFDALWEVGKAATKDELNRVTGFAATLMPEEAKGMIRQMATGLREAIPVVRQQLAGMASGKEGTIMYMLNLLLRALQVYESRKHRLEASVRSDAANQVKKQHAGDQVETRSAEAKVRMPGPSVCVTCRAGQPRAATGGAIGFGLGEESFSHTDFVLPGTLAVEWTRTYRSNFGAHDSGGPLGPRWTTPFHTGFEIRGDTLVCHDASGRSVDYPLLATGQAHYDAIGQSTLTRVSETQITVTRGGQLNETYGREGTRFVLRSITDRSGNALVLTHADGRLATVTGSSGEIAGLTHDEHGRITRIALLDEAGQEGRTLARYTYDEAGDLSGASDEDGASWSYTYSHHLVTRYTDRTGRGMNLQWNGTHREAKAVREWADDGTFDTRLEWHERLRLTLVTDALGHTTQQYYDIDGYPYRVVYPDHTEEWFFRDAAKNITRHVYPDGAEEQFTWDARGNLAAHTARDGRTAYFVHDRHDNLTGIQDPEGHRWERYHDSRGNVTEATDPPGRVTKYAFNDAGLPVEITDPEGGKKQLAWRPDGQIERYTDCPGKSTTWTYDGRGRLTAMRNAAGETTRYEYGAGQRVTLVRPDRSREVFERDAEGRLLTHTDALSRQTHYRYNAAGLVSSRTNAQGDALSYIWNRLGQIVGLRNENGSEYTFGYDAAGRLTSEKGFDGRTTRYYRAADSGVVTHQLEGDVMQALEYDAMGRLKCRRGWKAQFNERGRVLLQPQDGVKVESESFAYDGLGRLLHANNGHSRVQRFYDAVGNLERETLRIWIDQKAHTFVWRHEYNGLDVRVASVRPDGHRLDWLTYGAGHVHGLMLDGRAVVDFERDEAHRETGRELGNGLGQVTTRDSAGRLAHQVLQGIREHPAGKLMERRYRYDAAGQLEQVGDMRRGTSRYAYDPLGRLTWAQSSLGVETFAFDPASNLLERDERDEHGMVLSRPKSRSALLDNLLKDYAGTHYEYDERGNLRERMAHGEKTVFGWNSFNRMVSATTRQMEATYVYDALGRRIAKSSEAQVPWNLNAGSGWRDAERKRLNREFGYGLTLYGWDGDLLAYETSWEKRTTTHYVYEPESFTPLMQATGAAVPEATASAPPVFDSVAYYHCDQIGTPQELSDANGAIAWSAYYRAWGEAQEVIGDAARKAGISNPLRFAGQYFDHETGLHYNRHRYYDPHTGRFISRDPIGLVGGVNVYQYAPNPIEWIDPFGLSKTPVGAGRKQASPKANQNAKCPCRKAWEVNRFDRVCEAMLNGTRVKYFRDPTTELWWSQDTEGHGGSAWKVMAQVDNNLVHKQDADIYGDYMSKHKGDTGKSMPTGNMKCRDAKGNGE